MPEALTPEQIAQVIATHLVWLRGKEGGERANLRGADLQGANLRGANLQGADLQGADLRRADLQGADLQGADLWGANLWGANLQGANLRGADLWGANLPFRIIQIGPIGSRADCLVYRFDTAQVSTGCFIGTLDEFAAAVESTHGESQHGQDYRAVIVMLRDLIARAILQRKDGG